MSRFGSDPKQFFDSVYQDAAPWDIGGPQPALVELFAEHPPRGPVLDVGCGSGDLAIHLASSGLEVLGIDFSAGAIAQAWQRAAALPADNTRKLDFQVADALRPSLLNRRFGSIVDCGFLHLFESEECDRYAEEVASALLPGGRYYVLAFAVEFPITNVPRRVTEEDLRSWFPAERGWQARAVRDVQLQSRIAPVPAIGACLERTDARRSPGRGLIA